MSNGLPVGVGNVRLYLGSNGLFEWMRYGGDGCTMRPHVSWSGPLWRGSWTVQSVPVVARWEQPYECRYSFCGHWRGLDAGYLADCCWSGNHAVHHSSVLPMEKEQRIQKAASASRARRDPDYVSRRVLRLWRRLSSCWRWRWRAVLRWQSESDRMRIESNRNMYQSTDSELSMALHHSIGIVIACAIPSHFCFFPIPFLMRCIEWVCFCEFAVPKGPSLGLHDQTSCTVRPFVNKLSSKRCTPLLASSRFVTYADCMCYDGVLWRNEMSGERHNRRCAALSVFMMYLLFENFQW